MDRLDLVRSSISANPKGADDAIPSAYYCVVEPASIAGVTLSLAWLAGLSPRLIVRFRLLDGANGAPTCFCESNMTLDKRTRERLLAHCGELHQDDGVDPRLFFKAGKKRNKPNHKTRQLCDQVAQTLGLVLAGEFKDDRLHGLHVISVDPAPDASQLSVTVRTDKPCDNTEMREVLEWLAAVSGRLRFEVAAAISRKRTPRLLFRVSGPIDVGEVQP